MPIDICLERDSANDDHATVVAIHYPSGATVEKGAHVFDIENSKATQEVFAPEAGVLVHSLVIGTEVEFGLPIAQVAPADAPPSTPMQTTVEAVAEASAPAEVVVLATRRFSRAAQELAAQHGVAGDKFSTPFVTTRDVMALLGQAPSAPRAAPAPAKAPAAVLAKPAASAAGAPVGASKRAEIDMLVQGAGATMLSVLGTRLGPIHIRRAEGDLLEGKITDVVIYEASRLMRKYPRLNASYEDGRVLIHEGVHAGLAIDDGGRLVVYGIENADRISLLETNGAIVEAASRYAAKSLTSRELTRATFTVTDLSGEDLDYVLPLLPRGQSCILGVTRSAAAGYHVYAGFDHRVTEGREVAAFLGDLRARLQSFEAKAERTKSDFSCSVCGRSVEEATGRGGDQGLLKIVARDGRERLCCASCWNGW